MEEGRRGKSRRRKGRWGRGREEMGSLVMVVMRKLANDESVCSHEQMPIHMQYVNNRTHTHTHTPSPCYSIHHVHVGLINAHMWLSPSDVHVFSAA